LAGHRSIKPYLAVTDQIALLQGRVWRLQTRRRQPLASVELEIEQILVFLVEKPSPPQSFDRRNHPTPITGKSQVIDEDDFDRVRQRASFFCGQSIPGRVGSTGWSGILLRCRHPM
jgi:hypothetical protein